MAHSPSPTPSNFVSNHTLPQRLSATPPLSQQPISKRDKRRSAIEQRLKDVYSNFSGNREVFLRAQLNALSRDMYFINQANPYQNLPLEDRASDLYIDIGSLGDSGVRGSSGSVDGENRVPLGTYAADYVKEINDAMEDRDACLTEVDLRFKTNLEALQLEYEFAVDCAKAAHKAMKDSVRERLINMIRNKKKQIQKEKDQLDNADSNALFFNSSQFTITQPASPGGAQSNRKTRHTRHRLDLDNLEGTGESHKRKRKAPAEDHDSPGGSNGKNLEAQGGLYWDKGHTLFDPDQPIPLIAVERLFTPRELTLHSRMAVEITARQWATKRAKLNANGRGLNGSSHLPNGDTSSPEPNATTKPPASDSDPEEAAVLTAPMMDRTGSHATRSTRNNPALNPYIYDAFDRESEDQHRVFGIAVIEAMRGRVTSKDLEAPGTQALTLDEQYDDLALIEEAVGSERF